MSRFIHRSGALSDRDGFTLIEVVVAIFIVGVAVSIGITLYAASYSLARDNRLVRMASELASEQLHAIQAHPEQFTWPALDSGPTGALVLAGAEAGPQPFDAPMALPPEERSGRKALNEFEGFTWQAYAGRSDDATGYAEVTVVVQWVFEGKQKHFALTTLVTQPAGEDLT